MERNRLVIDAVLAECAALRYTPAGVPAQDVVLEHESWQMELEQRRTVRTRLRAVAFGSLAERLARQSLGSVACFSGFLAATRHNRSPVFHIQEFQLI